MQNLNEKSEEMAQREIESILEDLRIQNLLYWLWNMEAVSPSLKINMEEKHVKRTNS